MTLLLALQLFALHATATAGGGCTRPADDGGDFDVVIIGSGAAGLQAAWYLQKEHPELRSTVLEKGSQVGAFWERFPRGGELISFNKRFNLYPDKEVALRWDWNSLLTGSVGTDFPFRNFSKRFYPLRSEVRVCSSSRNRSRREFVCCVSALVS